MKILTLFAFLSMSAFNHASGALSKGDHAPCAVLEGITHSGGRISRCVRKPEREGQQHTLLKFFSAVCSDCLHLHNKMVDEFSTGDIPNKVKFNFIGIDRDSHLTKKYASQKSTEMSKLGGTVFVDSDRDAKSSYGVRQTPTVFVLDNTTNRILFHHEGAMDDDDFRELTQLLENF